MKRIYISSTFKDLQEHREAVAHGLRKMGYDVRCMEDYVATDERIDGRCKDDIASCDFYVGIIAQRYGWSPPGQDRSITEIEYRQARSQPDRTRCLMFLLDEDAPWPQRWVDALHDPEAARKLKALRTELDGNSNGTFHTVEDLVHEVMAGVHMEDAKTWKLALGQELKKLFADCKVSPRGAPDGFQNNYKLYLNSSGKNEIITVLQAAIRNMDQSKLVGIDLTGDGGWWSTRLLLLAGLLAGYTDVQKLVFSAGGRYLGTCGPAETRRALATFFADVEISFASSLPAQPGFDPAQDIPGIVTRFQEKLDSLGGEPTIKQMVEGHVVRRFPGFHDDFLPFQAGADEVARLLELLRKPHPYVGVEESSDGVVTIVNRDLLAGRIAQLAVERL